MLDIGHKNLLRSMITPTEILVDIARDPSQLETYEFCSKLSVEQIFDIHKGTSNNFYNARVIEIMKCVHVSYGDQYDCITVCYPENVIQSFGEGMDGKFSPSEIDERVIKNPLYQQELFMAKKVVLNKDYLPQVVGVKREVLTEIFQMKANGLASSKQLVSDFSHVGATKKRWIAGAIILNSIWQVVKP
jgi:hypothetical protein